MQSYNNIIDHIPYAVYYILMTFLLYNWWFILFNPLYLFHPHFYFWQPPVCSLYLWVCFHLFYFLDSTCKWDHMVYVFQSHSSPAMWIKCQDTTLCYGWVIFIYIYTYHIFFIHSSIDGHLGYFHILAIINNAVMNVGLPKYFQFAVFVFFW